MKKRIGNYIIFIDHVILFCQLLFVIIIIIIDGASSFPIRGRVLLLFLMIN